MKPSFLVMGLLCLSTTASGLSDLDITIQVNGPGVDGNHAARQLRFPPGFGIERIRTN